MGAGQFMPSSYRRYAVDGSNDDKRNLFADWDDIIASVANYFKQSGWVTDGPVLAEAVVQPDAPVTADPGNLSLNETVAGPQGQGRRLRHAAQAEATPRAADSRRTAGRARRIASGFKNFEVITRYNRSVRYAMAVHDLATTIAGRVAAANLPPTRRNQTGRAAAMPTTAAR